MFSYILTLFWTRNCKSPTQISNTSICFLANNTLFYIMHVYHISHNFIIISCSSVRNENKPTLDQECQVCLPDLLNQNLCPDESKRKKIQYTSTIHSSNQYCRYMHALNKFLISTQCMYLSKRKLTGLLRKKTETPPTRGAAGIRGRRMTRRLPRIYRRKIYSTNLGQQISSRVEWRVSTPLLGLQHPCSGGAKLNQGSSWVLMYPCS